VLKLSRRGAARARAVTLTLTDVLRRAARASTARELTCAKDETLPLLCGRYPRRGDHLPIL
jgi:hypothetical protein